MGEEVVSTENPFTTEPLNETVTFKAICEPASYQLTVRANDNNFGTVSAESVAGGSGTEIIVGHNMEATITATANPGYRFVNWTTKNGEEVSTNATYTIAGIENVEDMVDVEYVANFVEIGTYYRIAYKFEVPVETPAKSAATRAAGDVQTYTISPSTGVLTDGNPSTEWICTAQPELIFTAINDGGPVKHIYSISNGTKLSLNAYNGSGGHYSTTYTIAIDAEKYKITEYNISATAYRTVIVNGVEYSNGNAISIGANNL